MASRSTPSTPLPTLAELQSDTIEKVGEAAQALALTCTKTAAAVVDLVHLNPEGLNEEHVEAFVAMLYPCVVGPRMLAEIEPDLLRTHVGPARFAGITRQTAHSAAIAVADMVLRAICGLAPSEAPPRIATPGDKLAFDVPAVRRRLLEIQPFDGVLLAEMVKQEAAEMKQTREARREAENRDKALAAIDEQHRTTRTKTEVAEMCGVHPRTIYRWIEQGRLRCLEAEGKCIFDVREITLLSERNKTKKSASKR